MSEVIRDLVESDVIELRSADLFFSAECGLSCTYCYIGKGKSMAKINEVIRSELESGIGELLSGIYKDSLETLGLWGAEPTENLDIFISQVDDILDSLPNLRTISISSNFYLKRSVDRLIDLLDKIADYMKLHEDREINISYQCSLDGPSWISDESRQNVAGLGVTKSIVNNANYFIDTVSKKDHPDNLITDLVFKSTISPKFLEKMANDDEAFYGYYHFFDQFGRDKEFYDNNFRSMPGSGVPTMILPGSYTSKDALIWNKYIEKCIEKSKESNPYKYIDNTKLIPYLGSLLRAISDSDTKREQNHGYICGVSGFGLSLSTGGKFHICHRSYFFEDENYHEYSKTVLDEYAVARESRYIDRFINNINDREGLLRQLYVSYGFRDFFQAKFSYVMTTLYHLARYGQADPEYLTNEDYRKLSALFIVNNNCIIESYLMSGSFYTVPQETIKFWAGGSLRLLSEELVRRGLIS